MKKKGYVKTALALLLVAGMLAVAVFVPDAVSAWYDESSLGQVEYVDMGYEPYEIVCYESFAEKLEAASQYTSAGYSLYLVTLEEGQDACGDEELLALVNDELSELCAAGLFEEEVSAVELVEREFVELCPTQENRSLYPQNLCYWRLVCKLDDGSELSLRMDSEYHKLYTFSVRGEGMGAAMVWQERLIALGEEGCSQCWADYWGLDGVPSSGEGLDMIVDSNESAVDSWAQANAEKGGWSFSHALLTEEGVELKVTAFAYSWYGLRWSAASGLECIFLN